MAVSNVQQSASNEILSRSPSKVTTGGLRFSDALSAVAARIGVSTADVTDFFAHAPTAEKVADTAASLGLTKDQVTDFLDFAGYGGSSRAERANAVNSFLNTHSDAYRTDAQGSISAAPLKSTVAAAQPEKAMPAASDIKAFYASRPTEDQVTAKAKALGLNAAQFVQFRATGGGLDIQRISAPVLETMFVDSANRLGQDIGGSTRGGWTSYYAPKLGRAITKEEITSFFATNPSQPQIFKKASELGLSVSAVNNMMIGIGMTKPQDANKAYGTMDFALYKGTDGYSMDQFGHIVSGGGHTERINGDGSSTWVAYSGERPVGA